MQVDSLDEKYSKPLVYEGQRLSPLQILLGVGGDFVGACSVPLG